MGILKFFRRNAKLILTQFRQLRGYPVETITLGSVDYDRYWDSKRGTDFFYLSPFQKKRAKIVASYIDEGASVLDIGCGNGAILNYLKQKRSIASHGADVSEKVVTRLSETGVKTYQIDLSQLSDSDIENLPTVDYIVALEILEHLPNPEDILTLLTGKCRKGFIVSFPNSGYWMHRFRYLLGRFPVQWRLHPGEHLRFWTVSDAKWWLRAIRWRYSDFSVYEGIDILNKVWPSLFGMGIVMKIAPDK